MAMIRRPAGSGLDNLTLFALVSLPWVGAVAPSHPQTHSLSYAGFFVELLLRNRMPALLFCARSSCRRVRASPRMVLHRSVRRAVSPRVHPAGLMSPKMHPSREPEQFSATHTQNHASLAHSRRASSAQSRPKPQGADDLAGHSTSVRPGRCTLRTLDEDSQDEGGSSAASRAGGCLAESATKGSSEPLCLRNWG